MHPKFFAFICSATAVLLTSTAFAAPKAGKNQTQTMPGRGEPLADNQYLAGYNAPAAFKVNQKWCNWNYDTFLDLTFNYTHVSQDGMELGQSASTSTTTLNYVPNATVLTQNGDYTPGFKVGAGMAIDDWTVYTSYTWLRNTSTQSAAAPAVDAPGSGTGVWAAFPWFARSASTTARMPQAATLLASNWHIAMDLWDVVAKRPFYQGTTLTLNPFAGIRTAWIRQKLQVDLTEATSYISGTYNTQPIHSYSRSKSWAVGPRMGTEARCLLPMGFRLEGNCAANILFTRYTSVSHKEDAVTTAQFGLLQKLTNYDTLRPSIEGGLGFGWGSYIYDKEYHIDFSADYNFNVFWDQNMMRMLANEMWSGVSANGNLYTHGLTLTGRFDF